MNVLLASFLAKFAVFQLFRGSEITTSGEASALAAPVLRMFARKPRMNAVTAGKIMIQKMMENIHFTFKLS